MGKILIGWAEESIVPNKKVSLEGQFFERISECVESEITATAMAVESEDDEMILVSVDMVWYDEEMLALTRKKLAALSDEIDVMKLIVCATHTHPSLKTLLDGEGSNLNTAVSILNEFLPEGKKYEELVTVDDSVITPLEAGEFVTDMVGLAA